MTSEVALDGGSTGGATEVPALPGMDAQRLVRLAKASVADMRIDLDGAVVVTEAATGAYAVTPIIAALAGARQVYGFTRSTAHGSVADVVRQTRELAVEAGVLDRIEVRTDRPISVIDEADVVTNSGHVRPLDHAVISRMRPGAALPLMFESWEIQAGRFDLALDEAVARGIRVAGTNERHPLVDVFSYLGTMAVKLLFDAGTAVRNTRIVVACDNPFASYLASRSGCGRSRRSVHHLGGRRGPRVRSGLHPRVTDADGVPGDRFGRRALDRQNVAGDGRRAVLG